MLRALMMLWAMMATAAPAVAETAQSGDPAVISVARSYLDAYQALDLVRLETFYAENATFDDPTSMEAPGIGGPFVWRGRAEIIAAMATWKENISSLCYDIEELYEASGRVVFIGAVNPVVGTPDGPIQFRYRIVTIVTVADGRVREHRDYTDYAGATQVAGTIPRRCGRFMVDAPD